MFNVGDYVVYGTNGVCKVTSIGPIDCPGVSRERLYYTMTPCYIRDSSVSTPVDNTRVVMRKVMTRAEAEELIDRMDEIDELEVREEKKREIEYKSILLSCDPEEIVRLIKAISERIKKRTGEGKKITSSDSKYIHIAEDSLYGELAIALGMERDNVGDYIKSRLEEKLGA
jgi:CarD family transcriptional regulator